MRNKQLSTPRKTAWSLNSRIEKASKLQKGGKFNEALQVFEECIKKDKNNKFILINIGLCKFHLGLYTEAAKCFHRLHQQHPEDQQIINFCGISYMKAGVFEIAGEFLKRYIKHNPNDFETWLNLTQIAGSTQNNAAAAFYATQALSVNPLDARAHSNLGCALLMLEKIDEALIPLDTAIQLDPKNFSAISNIASAYEKKGDYLIALDYYRKSIEIATSNGNNLDELKCRMSLSLLGAGQLSQGWEYWDLGFNSLDSRSRNPKRQFKKPTWNGEDLENKTLMVWREQGIGDEIRLFGLVNELVGKVGKIIIECQPRLLSLFQRSFPDCMVRIAPEYSSSQVSEYIEDFDFHIPVGSIPRHLRTSTDSFCPILPYLKIDTERVSLFSDRLSKFQGMSLLGISWRSGFVTSERIKYLTPISDWEAIFKLENTVFVNLQYGECQEEILQAEKAFGISIVHWQDINLKEDMESAAALTSLLDYVVSAPTSVADIAMAVGANLKFFTPRTWEFLGFNDYPWYSNAKAYIPPPNQQVSDMLKVIAQDLAQKNSRE